ncbi:MAG TPA: plasmid pRiA4b ORF-3 family protein [Longimicrobium sp.]|nr:plasmid pRiA4b ORF-3 family protein [Longimicrobium sp.]
MPPSKPAPAPARRGPKPKPRALDLRISLAEIEPPIWRRVRVPDAYTLDQLHRLIQMLFGWRDEYRYGFEAAGEHFEPSYEEGHDDDDDGTPSVRLRDLQLGKGARFTYTYGFRDQWTHEIVVADVYIITPMDEDDERLLPMLYGGERAGPREEVGDPASYREMMEARADPHHPEHGHDRLWAGIYDPEQFDVWMTRNNLILAAVWGAI